MFQANFKGDSGSDFSGSIDMYLINSFGSNDELDKRWVFTVLCVRTHFINRKVTKARIIDRKHTDTLWK